MPHQGVVAATISAISLVITLGLLVFMLRHEKKNQTTDDPDEH